MSTISDLRRDYAGDFLDRDNTPETPWPLFSEWLNAAVESERDDANVMTLATADNEGMPHARIVLLKHFDENGMVFYTSYQSHKGSELGTCPYAALVFWWPTLQRQVRVEGHVEQVSSEASDAYFHSRPQASQLGAWISQQSVEIPNRQWLDERTRRFESAYQDNEVERPPHWGGYRVVPAMVEFWQGQPSRLHDRIRYCWRAADGHWLKSRLAP
ncbi:pyridoxine/pyridoxamine 5'-phosphate oxidase [Kushneria pakistanensis]|uniref:Pyridoxine/pyridoxamine 5'-phosphate oxidase n=1 Tax=Kushneria pakistanensis TaxID=1508770 RepID=A0ABQ3FE62_9GAMM|nr:pyridoxamine 5'-phosphate oxidase [Kushneria pakistanensis]GHC20064.1 pyridoxine/pyridoxamine 5'-phosphate oxidase [Kushneria pakistanensis]